MSSVTSPISSAQFTLAIQDLPLENIYTKAQELENSIAHLRRSNATLQEYSDSIKSDSTIDGATREEVGDTECLDAIKENNEVIERQAERIGLLRKEVERRGRNWHGPSAPNGESGTQNGTSTNTTQPSRVPGGTISDDELRRRMEEQMAGSDDDGMHL